MRKMCTLITSKSTDIDENIANQNHATRKPKPGYLKPRLHYAQFLVRYGTDEIGTRTTFLVLGLPI